MLPPPYAKNYQAVHEGRCYRISSVTPEMALRLGKLCGNGPELWLALQTRYDLERLSREKAAEIEAIPTLGGTSERLSDIRCLTKV